MLVVKSKIAQLTNYWIRWSWRENIKLEDKIEDFYKEKRNIGKEMKMLSQLNFDILESDFTNKYRCIVIHDPSTQPLRGHE